MTGSIIGDIVGSVYEFRNIKTKDFTLFGRHANYTDDSILTLATADWLLHGGEAARYYCRHAAANPCPMGGYGGRFSAWVEHAARYEKYVPYNSCGNGSAMRVGPIGWISLGEDDVLRTAALSAACTHNHPEGVKGAQATALSILLSRQGRDRDTIRRAIETAFGYDLSFSVAYLQEHYSWRGMDGGGDGALCQDSVPQAIVCALQATDFEDALRNAVSIGGDSDTVACIAGSIAEALYGIPQSLHDKGMSYLPAPARELVRQFEARYGNRVLP